MISAIDADFAVLEWDQTKGIVYRECDFVNHEGYFYFKSKERKAEPEKARFENSPATAKTIDLYLTSLKSTLSRVIPFSSTAINDLWSSIELNEPGNVKIEGQIIPLQVEKDLPRIHYLTIDGRKVYSNLQAIQNVHQFIFTELKSSLQIDLKSTVRIGILLTQASHGYQFLYLNDNFSHIDYGSYIVQHNFSSIYINTSPLVIRMSKLFKLISTVDGNAIGYFKGERIYELVLTELETGVCKTSAIYDCISPFFENMADAIAFSYVKPPKSCQVL